MFVQGWVSNIAKLKSRRGHNAPTRSFTSWTAKSRRREAPERLIDETRETILASAQVFTSDRIYTYVSRKYEIRSGRRIVSTRLSSNALEAAIDYARVFGSPNEIIILGTDTVSWRGARFTAVRVPDEPAPPVWPG